MGTTANEIEIIEPLNRHQTAFALRQSLKYLEREALEAGFYFTAHLIGIAALSASEIESEN